MDEGSETDCFPMPQNASKDREHSPIQTRILKEIRELEQLEKLNLYENTQLRIYSVSIFDQTDSSLAPDAQ